MIKENSDVKKKVVVEVLVFKRKGLSQREIARRLGIHRKTVKKYLKHPELIGRHVIRKPRRSILTSFAGIIESWLDPLSITPP